MKYGADAAVGYLLWYCQHSVWGFEILSHVKISGCICVWKSAPHYMRGHSFGDLGLQLLIIFLINNE